MRWHSLHVHRLTTREHLKALLVGIVNAVLLSLIMVPAMRAGLAPLPKPPSQAFAETLFGPVPLAVGLLFHVVYVTFWSWLYVVIARDRLTFGPALGLGIALWVVILFVFFPVIGWGFLGLNISPRLMLVSLVPHLLFALFVWALANAFFGEPVQRRAPT